MSRPWISSLTWCCWMCLWSFKFCPFLKIYFESRETKTERDFPSTGFFLKFSQQLGKMKPAAGPPCGWWGPKYLSCFLLAAEACNNRKLETEGLEPTGYLYPKQHYNLCAVCLLLLTIFKCTWRYTCWIYLLIFLYLIWKSERSPFTASLPKVLSSQGLDQIRGRSSELVSHVVDNDPSTWAIMYYLPECASPASWGWKQSQDWNTHPQ